MDIDSITAQVAAFLEDPENEALIAQEVALEVARVMAPVIVQDMAAPEPAPGPDDDRTERNADH